jgi:hypothetical protein
MAIGHALMHLGLAALFDILKYRETLLSEQPCRGMKFRRPEGVKKEDVTLVKDNERVTARVD